MVFFLFWKMFFLERETILKYPEIFQKDDLKKSMLSYILYLEVKRAIWKKINSI